MKCAMLFFGLLTAMTGSVRADARSITFFSDGAIAEIEATATKGIVEIPLSPGMIDNTLRIKPLGGTMIQRVDFLSVRRETRGEKELDTLLERKNRLEDRLQALTTREEIFKAAVKSQSSKAPRKTKSNPDPMLSIRQGTDFAIAQLEAVNTARRKTTLEMLRIDTRIAEMRKGGTGTETVARVSVTPNNGRLRIRYALAGQTWTPRYDIRMNGDGKAALTLYGQLPRPFAGYLLRAAPATLADSDNAHSFPVTAGSVAKLAEFILPAREEQFGIGLTTSFSSILTNKSTVYLPAGEASIFRNNEYVGRARFERHLLGTQQKNLKRRVMLHGNP